MDKLDYLEEYDKLKTKVLKYVLYKKRTEKEIFQKFSASIEEEILEDIIEELKENGYISDENYIERAVAEFMALKNMSLREMKYKLMAKGISTSMIEDFFAKKQEELEEFEKKSIQNIYIKKQGLMEVDEIVQFLSKKGYKSDHIKEVLREVE